MENEKLIRTYYHNVFFDALNNTLDSFGVLFNQKVLVGREPTKVSQMRSLGISVAHNIKQLLIGNAER